MSNISEELMREWFKFAQRYEAEIPLRFGVFDERVMLSWQQTTEAIFHETGKELGFEDLMHMEEQGWVPIDSRPDYPMEIGIPLYVPSRIQWLWTLQAEGYSAQELRKVAEYEEDLVSYITADHLAYILDPQVFSG
jgi:hypothetical protein